MAWRFILTLCITIISAFCLSSYVSAQNENNRLITVYDRGVSRVFISNEKTLGEALNAEGVSLDAHDTVEPSADETLVASEYKVNIYRARPVIVVDGAVRIKTISPFQTAKQIAKDVGIVIYDEDITKLEQSTDFVNDGAGLVLTISRAKTLVLDLYGKKTKIHTRASTVKDLLEEKNIKLGKNDRSSVPLGEPILPGMEIRVWREGKQTVAIDQEIPVISRIVYDADRPIGYRAIQKKGVAGNRSVTYVLEIKDGVELSRKEIANIVTRQPTEQTEVIGIYNDGSGLTQSRGAQYFVDSKGVSHRETYYDLNMSRVMQSCGQAGYYSVRPDGAKVDAQGYIIIAANLAAYPRCSIVETSLGPAKVYDTGGFVARYPYGFDLATDWSRADGI